MVIYRLMGVHGGLDGAANTMASFLYSIINWSDGISMFSFFGGGQFGVIPNGTWGLYV